MIMIRALVCSSQPTTQASPRRQPRIRPAAATPASLPPTDAASSSAAAPNTAGPPRVQRVRSPVERK